MARNFGLPALAMTVAAAAISHQLAAQPGAGPAVKVDADDIGGVVTGPNGPEAGVWVIAETAGLPTKYAKMVVTDERGRYLLPDLPRAHYDVWVRGYDLVDSPKVRSAPGRALDLAAVTAPDAAAYYPAIYWYSMLKVPPADQFGSKGDIPAEGNFLQTPMIREIKTHRTRRSRKTNSC